MTALLWIFGYVLCAVFFGVLFDAALWRDPGLTIICACLWPVSVPIAIVAWLALGIRKLIGS